MYHYFLYTQILSGGGMLYIICQLHHEQHLAIDHNYMIIITCISYRRTGPFHMHMI